MMRSSRKYIKYFNKSFQITHKNDCANYIPIYDIQEYLPVD